MFARAIAVARLPVQAPQAQAAVRGERAHLERVRQVERSLVRRLHRRDVRRLAARVDVGEQASRVRLLAALLALLGRGKGPSRVV